MDFEEKRKRQKIRVIVSEILMVLAVIAVVVVSTMAAMGFIISGDGEIEQTGLMQLHTLPTGAGVRIDGATIFGRTNLSRTLSAGDHEIEIYRDGYDTWQKTITVRSGVLMRLYYPRLFLTSRTSESVKELAKAGDLDIYVPSPNHNYILYAEKGAAEWQVVDIRGDELKTSVLDMSGVLPGMIEEKTATQRDKTGTTSHTYKFEGQVSEVRWSANEENLLVKVHYDNKSEWVVVRMRDIASSVNLSRTFGLGEDVKIEAIDSAMNQLYVLEKQQLRRINLTNTVMSRILVDGVIDFANEGAKVIYLAGDKDNKEREIGVFRDDEKSGTTLEKIPEDVSVKIAITSYYDEDYMIWTEDKKLNILFGRVPSYDESGMNLGSLKTLMSEDKLAEVPDKLQTSPGGEYVLATKGETCAIVDLDSGDFYEYDAAVNVVKWFDDSMFYAVTGGQIAVWDFDGTNWRNLSESAKDNTGKTVVVKADSLVTVNNNNRFMYYLTTNDNSIYLSREMIKD